MKIGYLFLIVASLLSGLKEQEKPVLFIGKPCACMAIVDADCCEVGDKLTKLLAERDYRWVVVFEPVENRQALAGQLLRTQPLAEIVLMADEPLAGAYRLRYAPDCCTLLEMMKKDREIRWKNES